MIASWSFSRLLDFEACQYRAYLKYDLRIPEPERPLPPGKTEHANDRGTRIHTLAEDYVAGRLETLPPELAAFTPELAHARALFQDGRVSLEGQWGMDQDWTPCAWSAAWQRCKLDAIVRTGPHTAVVIDYKTGRKFGNEIKHGQQLQLYTVNTFLRFPDIEQVTGELWYLDQDEITAMTFTRKQGLRLKGNFDQRGHAVTDCTEFAPNPNAHSCRWCMYGPAGICKTAFKP